MSFSLFIVYIYSAVFYGYVYLILNESRRILYGIIQTKIDLAAVDVTVLFYLLCSCIHRRRMDSRTQEELCKTILEGDVHTVSAFYCYHVL